MTTTTPMIISTAAGYGRPEGIEAVVYRLGLTLMTWARARLRWEADVREASVRRAEVTRTADGAYESARARAASTRMV